MTNNIYYRDATRVMGVSCRSILFDVQLFDGDGNYLGTISESASVPWSGIKNLETRLRERVRNDFNDFKHCFLDPYAGLLHYTRYIRYSRYGSRPDFYLSVTLEFEQTTRTVGFTKRTRSNSFRQAQEIPGLTWCIGNIRAYSYSGLKW